jgi:hypothetical protein
LLKKQEFSGLYYKGTKGQRRNSSYNSSLILLSL